MTAARRSVAGGLAAASLLSGCATVDYYAHLARGQAALLGARRPIAELVAAPDTDERLRARLQRVQQARRFASEVLALPDNGSYTAYADIGRPWAVRNLFAAPELSLQPVEQCFPIAGCVAYRGYYDAARAEAEAARLRAQGHDTWIGDVAAYSTLGWFDDPLLSTMLRWDDAELIGTVFHELAHQRLYVPGDTAFNESFASFVEQEGLRRWQQAQGLPVVGDAQAERATRFVGLMLGLRERLQAIYASPRPDEDKRQAKRAAIARLREDYRALRDGDWRGDGRYDAFVAGELNNASLLPFGLYHALVPGFARLCAEAGGDLPTFYRRAEALGRAAPDARARALSADSPDP